MIMKKNKFQEDDFMNKEKIVEKLYGALRVMQDVDVEAVLKTAKDADGRSSSLAVFSEYPEFHVADLIVALESDILNETAKKNGTATKLKACKNILANAKKSGKESYYKPYIKDGYQHFCDSITLVCLKDKLDMENGNEYDCLENIDISRMPTSDHCKDVSIPDKRNLEMEYKKYKALKIKPIVFKIYGKIFDAEKFINLLNCVEPDKVGVSEKAVYYAGMVRVEDNNGNIGFLCGIKDYDMSDNSIIKIEDGKIIGK